MSIKVKVSPCIVNSIAHMYQNASRIFMEYIDNSLDSAEKLCADNDYNSYPYKITIAVKIDPEAKSVAFEDNCMGMSESDLLRIVQYIGNSNKKNDFITNGQFGFGIHAYVACAHKIDVLTVTQESPNVCKISVDRTAYTEDGEIHDLERISRDHFPHKSGTIVVLSNFESEWWKEIAPDVLKAEIEKHFEQLLARHNLEIKIQYGNEEEICQPFNYDAFMGIKIEEEMPVQSIDSKTPILAQDGKPVKIFLKVTDDIIPNKRPLFLNKGRRIEEVQAIKSFRNKSKHRTSLWAHNNLTGFIEVAGLLSPTLARDDFKRNKCRSAIYERVLQLEDKIDKALQEINKRSEDANMGKLENLLSSALSKLAQQDNLRFRTRILEGVDINLQPKPSSDIDFERGGKLPSPLPLPLPLPPPPPPTPPTPPPPHPLPPFPESEKVPVVQIPNESSQKGQERKKTGFNVEFSDREQKKADGTLLRSDFIEGSAIIIYTSHPDFKQRIKRTNQGDMKITERLISYLASEISIQYKDKFFDVRGKQPEVQAIMNHRKDLFIDIVEFAYNFESMLQPFVGKNLLTLESMENSDENVA